jgi:hypothetical protein
LALSLRTRLLLIPRLSNHLIALRKNAVVDSIGECNIIGSIRIKGDVASGSNGTTRTFSFSKRRHVAAMEEGRVA